MNREKFVNIKELDVSDLHKTFKFCFTYNVQPALKVSYTTNKGKVSKRLFRTLPFLAQKEFLTKGIKQLNSVAYYFEQCKDGRYHIHAFCEDSVLNVLTYIKERYNDTKLQSKTDIQDYCLLCEKVDYAPSWVAYCQKEQKVKDVFVSEIEKFINGQIDSGIVKIETNNYRIPEDYTLHPESERLFENYLFGKKKFILEI